MSNHPGNSNEQRQAEPLMLALLEAKLGLSLHAHELTTPGGATLQLDGWCDDPLVLCESWAHQGRAKPAQSAKVMRDAFKLTFAERVLGRPARKILLFGCTEAAGCFQKGWPAEALHAFGVELHVVDLTPEVRGGLRDAHLGGHLKTGHSWTGQNRPPRVGSETGGCEYSPPFPLE